jgi:hypothetical protein
VKTRPWPLILLALAQILAPLPNILVGAWVTRMAPGVYVSELLRASSWLQLADFFLLLPIAGVAVFMVRAWSYPVFVGIMGWIGWTNYLTWRQHPHVVNLGLLVGAYLVNAALVGYFLLPAVRAAYFNPRLRWWESKPRYLLNLPGRLDAHNDTRSCMLVNLSEGGAFIEAMSGLEPGQVLKLSFECLEQRFELHGRIVHQATHPGRGYGVQFILDREQRKQLKGAVRAFERLGTPRRPEKRRWTASFVEWVQVLFRTGKGWVPEVPARSRPGVQKRRRGLPTRRDAA